MIYIQLQLYILTMDFLKYFVFMHQSSMYLPRYFPNSSRKMQHVDFMDVSLFAPGLPSSIGCIGGTRPGGQRAFQLQFSLDDIDFRVTSQLVNFVIILPGKTETLEVARGVFMCTFLYVVPRYRYGVCKLGNVPGYIDESP